MSERIGTVARLQVQRTPLRRGATYDPSPLLDLTTAAVSARGVVGLHQGGWVLDTHHDAHPEVRGRGLRGVSVGFTSHYASMVERYGAVRLGVAGENIIIETDRLWSADDLAAGITIAGVDGSSVRLETPRPAEPCLEFTSFLLGLRERAPRDQVISELDFLSGGMRGFLVEAGRLRTPFEIAVGAEAVLG